MNETLVAAVRERAGHACEYCLLSDALHPGPFEVEHIVARQHSGSTVFGNLAYSCLHCNRHKGPNLTGIDRRGRTQKIVRLFHPRQHKWTYHFRWEGPLLVGRTAIGRVTVAVLAMNDPVRIALREQLIAEGTFPPEIA
jgi:hypothetical protein